MSLNESFLSTLTRAFETYLQTSARSNEKLKILHAKIASDLTQKLGNEFEVKSYGVGDGKEKSLVGRYYMIKRWIFLCCKMVLGVLAWRLNL